MPQQNPDIRDLFIVRPASDSLFQIGDWVALRRQRACMGTRSKWRCCTGLVWRRPLEAPRWVAELGSLLHQSRMSHAAALSEPDPAPEEDEVALVVEGGHLAAAEAGVLVEQRREHAPRAVPQPRAEVVQHQLRLRARRAPVPLQPDERVHGRGVGGCVGRDCDRH